MREAEALRNEVFEDGPISACREDTVASHRRAVERVITDARERLCEPISLQDMSRVAYISTFHFNRVFHQITGLPPAKFISAMRLDQARRLLLNTNLSITDICLEVGYNSLSTFTRRFTQRVGLGPREFRYLAERITPASVESLCAHYAELTRPATVRGSIEGFVDSPNPGGGPIFVGLFPAHIPQSRPVGGALLTSPGVFSIGPVPDGTYYLLAAALPRLADTLGYLLPDSANLSVGAWNGPVIVQQGRASGPFYISLRPMALTDPPLLISLPFLLADTLK
ncbi:MAG TPA: helix-turn-helix transcriptional regulator [Pyrinomonadaceae bacterium]|jgi:AraC-like DNA-binding protein|nr:helix-turn-helix transcriptional regulator [Pyrinomonadaceae bacterium]